ncbi:hypothetical protein [Piscibacillus salipiscarius]|uniref:hypothetical protein n=1 Tax=Piscibacillus salipiscarius TaxID=299480 RepID=UPI0006D074CD|nr:hypothetical protein [Piscibacillus salipiscarius]
MINHQFTILDAKSKSLKLRAERMANYVQAQILEAVSDDQELYYLFFYKGAFLTAKRPLNCADIPSLKEPLNKVTLIKPRIRL